jgi:hypothetical protein
MATMCRLLRTQFMLIGVGLMLMGLAVACGSAPASTTSEANNSGAPTQTLFPTYQFVLPTEAPQKPNAEPRYTVWF